LIGDYSPAAKLGSISEVRTNPAPATESSSNASPVADPLFADPAPPAVAAPAPSNPGSFGDRMRNMFDPNCSYFKWSNLKSDHCFDDFISPVTNPFLAEDPRALTELRPVFFYQTIPHGSVINGGNLEFFGLRGSIAFNERFSITLDKLGFVVLNPGAGSTAGGATSLSELWFGPKVTFFRDEQSGTIAAAGAIFQIPTGPNSTFQDTGHLSIVPYGTVAQQFGKTSYGAFHVLDTAGVALSTNDQRSDYFYNSIHLDFDVANAGRVYPLIELNWFHYVSNGQARVLPFEGGDVANVGSAHNGRDYLNLAIGSRFKVSDTIQLGLAAEFPLLNTKDLFNFRLGFDLIWRY
jgi:hypothetical protein